MTRTAGTDRGGSTDESQGPTRRTDEDGREAVVFEGGELPPWAPTSLDRLPRDRRQLVLRCSSGRRSEGEWVGVPVPALLGATDAPDTTTHLLVQSAGGYVACVSVADVRDAILALEADRFDDETTAEATPRLVGPGVEARRAVKAVTRIVATSLRPGEDPAAYERDPR